MPRKKAVSEPAIAQAFLVRFTPNQVVAYNLTAAREWKGWTQDEFAEHLEPHIGLRWSKASVSQAERSVSGGYVRNFNADEIVAFARTFGLPVSWFFLPPPPFASAAVTGGEGTPAGLDVPDAEVGESLAALFDLVFGDEDAQALMLARLRGFLEETGDTYPLSAVQARIERLVRGKADALVVHALSEVRDWQTTLRSLADGLRNAETRAARTEHEESENEDDMIGETVRRRRAPSSQAKRSEDRQRPSRGRQTRGKDSGR